MDVFTTIVLVVIGGTLLLALLAGTANRRASTRIVRQRERRDPIADGAVKPKVIDRGLETENAQRGRWGLRPLKRGHFESLIVADGRTRRRLLRWGGRRT